MHLRRRPTSWWGKNSSGVPGSWFPKLSSTGKSSKSRFGISILLEPSGVQWKHLPGSHPITLCGNSLRKKMNGKKKTAFKYGFRFFPPPEKIPSSDGLQHGSSFKRSPTLAAGLTEPTAGMRSVAYFHWDHCVGNPWQRLCSTFWSSACVYICIYLINCAFKYNMYINIHRYQIYIYISTYVYIYIICTYEYLYKICT